MHAYFYVFSSVALGAVGQVLMKLGTNKVPLTSAEPLLRKLIMMFTQPYILGGLTCYALSAVLWIFALSRMQLSLAYPMVAAGYVIVFIISVLLFKEAITIQKVGGMMLIMAGVIVLAK
ncbi:EamA family transporter [Paenibacillus sp. MZ04-78.2]|uniref:SMR family transporter n=1 Tax=Paenibacillus sp. MZ04-78.2 TaxID=2962034 RepID=UPI0020B7FC46|nr:SMR family transporter [Paenibacillus sp. MZ04-78.2]MCP3776527.1 EamA family transporter [Paenibacillus sp. MZ04-78.2]